jgi:cell division protein FtsL
MVTNRKIFGFLFLLAVASAIALLGSAFAAELFAAEAEHATLIRDEALYSSEGANGQ